jgi:hypothetical protein
MKLKPETLFLITITRNGQLYYWREWNKGVTTLKSSAHKFTKEDVLLLQ